MNQRDPLPTAVDTFADDRKKMGRRALIAAAGLGVVGVAAAEAPAILNGVGKLTEQQIQNAINQGRQQLAKELIILKDDTGEIAVNVAEEVSTLTHGAVTLFVIPIAKLLAGLTEVTLDIAIGAVEKAQGFSKLVHLDIEALTSLDGILHQWKANVAFFPSALDSLNKVGEQSDTRYLTTLRKKLEQEAASAGQ